jgi:hypothetical protein
MNGVVLSGANAIVLSGARGSCYQVHGEGLSSCSRSQIDLRNSSNYKTLGFPLTQRLLWITVTFRLHYHDQQRTVRQITDQKIERERAVPCRH